MESVSKSTRAKRVTAGVAAVCASTLAAGALVAGPELAANAAPAGSTAKKVTVAKKGIGYRCKATNSVVNDAMGGPQKFLIDVNGKFAGTFKPGSKVTTKSFGLALVLPPKLVKKVRKQLGVRKVKGSADAKFGLLSKPGGEDGLKIMGLKSGWKKLPKKGSLRIPTSGTAGSFKIKKGTKSLKLLAPKNFQIHANLRPPAVGIVKKTDMKCKLLDGRKVGNFPV